MGMNIGRSRQPVPLTLGRVCIRYEEYALPGSTIHIILYFTSLKFCFELSITRLTYAALHKYI